MSLNEVELEVESTVAYVTINRPKALNALNNDVIIQLGKVFTVIEENLDIRSVVLTGSGEKSFVAGADIKEMIEYGEKEALALSKKGQDVFLQIEMCSKPVIAAVNGFALGGGFELALACDFIVASENAQFGLPEVGLGLIPGYGGTQRLSRIIGLQKAKRLIFSGEMINAEKAYDWGVVTQVVSQEELLAVVAKLAVKISRQAPVAIGFAKQSVANGYDVSIGEGLSIESHFFSKTFLTEDKKEGISAFIEKRKPSFKGK